MINLKIEGTQIAINYSINIQTCFLRLSWNRPGAWAIRTETALAEGRLQP